MITHRSPNSSRGLAAPKRLGEGGTCRVEVPHQRNVDGFTLLEIMIVVMIVAILSLLAMVAVGRIKEHAARTVILNNLRQLYDAKEFYFSGTPDDPKSGSIITLANKGFISATVKDRLMSPRSYEAALGWHYSVTIKPGESVFAYKGIVSGDKPNGEAIYYPNRDEAAPAQAPALAAPAVGGVTLMRTITGATALSAFSGAQSGVPTGTRLVGLYMAGNDVNQLGHVDSASLPSVSTGYTRVGDAGYQYLDQSGALGRLMPGMADNLRPMRPEDRNAWDGGIAVFSDGTVARMLKACNGNGSEKDYVYFSKLEGVNANEGMAVVRGTAPPGQTVQVMDGSRVLASVKADAQGNWNFAGPAALASGSSSLSVVPVPPGN